MLKTEPSKGQTLTLCQIIEENFKGDPKIQEAVGKLKSKAYKWYRRDNLETVS
tara:strand:+ start:339 stop:497 length:159 start_codon:yes stop_codon:yes gene_type:complete